MSYQPHESLYFLDPSTQKSIPYSAGTSKPSNTWVNPNLHSTTSTPPTQPSPMMV